MVFVGKRCFKIHRVMLMIIGLWPYQKPFIWRIQSVFFFSAYCCTLFFQLSTFVMMTCNMDCILKRFSYICICCVYILNYYAFYFNSEIVRKTLQHIQFDWKMFENSDIMHVFEEYLFEAYIFVSSALIFVILSAIIFTLFECRSIILDVISPLNESRPRKIEMDFELFVDQEQYFVLYLVQEILGGFIGGWAILTSATFLTTVMKHFCAAYKIASYLIQNTVTVRTLQLPVAQRMKFMHRSICLSVYIHKRTLEFCKGLFVSFGLWYFPLLLICVLSLSCLLFRLYNALMQFNNFHDIMMSCAIIFSYFVYMLMANFLAQSYTEHSVGLLKSTYDTLWYVAPLSIQKSFLIMQKSIKSHKIVLGGLFVASIEGFSTLITSAVSYFTLLHVMCS